jgi:hypothetical protein
MTITPAAIARPATAVKLRARCAPVYGAANRNSRSTMGGKLIAAPGNLFDLRCMELAFKRQFAFYPAWRG